MTQEQAEVAAVAKVECLNSFLFFTRYLFKAKYGRKFVVGEHHKIIADVLERVFKGEVKRLIINIAPRYGKTELAVKNMIAYGLALNPAAKFIHLSYSDDLALDNSEDTKSIVEAEEYKALFPEVQIKKNSDSKKKWYTTENGGVYATSAAGQVTGFGAGRVDDEEALELAEFYTEIETKQGFNGAIIIDDPIKPEDADSELTRERVNSRYDSTISNRVNSRNTPIIIIMQRLHERDLCGHLIDKEGTKWLTVSLPAIKPNGEALWPFKHTLQELKEMELLNPVVFERQYMQKPMPLAGRLYKTFKTYKQLPVDCTYNKAVVDTADTGSDSLCCIVYSPCSYGYYVIDIYYTTDGMETTESETARRFTEHDVRTAKIESNNGGRTFARNVERDCRSLGNTKTAITWFHQTKNKEARIITNAADVQNMVYYPADWETRWPAYARHIKNFMASGKNEHDDAEDAITMVVEAEKKKGNKGIEYI